MKPQTLVATVQGHEHDMTLNKQAEKRATPASNYWLQNIARKNVLPFNSNSSYVLYRNVMDYGATGVASLEALVLCLMASSRFHGLLLIDSPQATE